jgi:hypothetical protein
MRSSQSLDNYSLGQETLAGVYCFYIVIIIIGSAMNLFVIYHMHLLRRRDKEQVKFVKKYKKSFIRVQKAPARGGV